MLGRAGSSGGWTRAAANVVADIFRRAADDAEGYFGSPKRTIKFAPTNPLHTGVCHADVHTVEWIDSDNYDLDNLYAQAQSFQSPRIARNTLTIHNIKYGDQTSYLVTAPGGIQTEPGTPFYDSATGVHIQLISVQETPATATVQVSINSTNTIWANGVTSGTPPVDTETLNWVGVDVPAGDSVVPANSIIGGSDPNVGNLYVCRTWFNGVQLGKVVWKSCSFPWGGSEHFQSGPFQTLTAVTTGNTSWVPGSNGSLPANAVASGFDGGNTLYVCRAQVAGNWTPGKFIFGQCAVAWGGKEIWNHDYEVLTLN